MKTKERKDWLTPVAVVGGGAMLVAGAVLVFKKGPHVPPGGTVKSLFKFNYNGGQGDYILQVSLGHVIAGGWFDHIDGMIWTRNISIANAGYYEEELDCPIPEGTEEDTYDAEALIQDHGMGQFEYIVKHVTRGAVRIA